MYNQGWWHMDLTFIVRRLCVPVITFLCLCLCVPYVIAMSIVPLFGQFNTVTPFIALYCLGYINQSLNIQAINMY